MSKLLATRKVKLCNFYLKMYLGPMHIYWVVLSSQLSLNNKIKKKKNTILPNKERENKPIFKNTCVIGTRLYKKRSDFFRYYGQKHFPFSSHFSNFLTFIVQNSDFWCKICCDTNHSIYLVWTFPLSTQMKSYMGIRLKSWSILYIFCDKISNWLWLIA